jgi:hypothetical protein
MPQDVVDALVFALPVADLHLDKCLHNRSFRVIESFTHISTNSGLRRWARSLVWIGYQHYVVQAFGAEGRGFKSCRARYSFT